MQSQASFATSCPSEGVLLDYVDGRIPPALRGRIGAHAEHCPRCDLALAWHSRSAHSITVGREVRESSHVDSKANDALRTLHLLPGRTLGRYRLERPIGRGGMGLVYEARDELLQRTVALKLLVGTGGDAATQDRALHEARSMARLTHPNVVRVYDVSTLDGEVAVSMELIRGRTLGEWLSGRPRRDAVIKVMLGVARALLAAHKAGIVHRDLKPANVLIDEDGRPKVTDFGLATLVDVQRESTTIPPGDVPERPSPGGSMAGTPAYVAPEVLRGDSAGPAADQYALGVCLYEALVGARPYVARTFEEARANAGRMELRWPPSVPTSLRRVVMRLMSQRPEDRYPEMGAAIRGMQDAMLNRKRRRVLLVVTALAVPLTAGLLSTRLRQAPPSLSRSEDLPLRAARSEPATRPSSLPSPMTEPPPTFPSTTSVQTPPLATHVHDTPSAPRAVVRPVGHGASSAANAPTTPSQDDDEWLHGRR